MLVSGLLLKKNSLNSMRTRIVLKKIFWKIFLFFILPFLVIFDHFGLFWHFMIFFGLDIPNFFFRAAVEKEPLEFDETNDGIENNLWENASPFFDFFGLLGPYMAFFGFY